MMSNFKRNIILLLSTSAISQFIAIFSIPILSQFYSPEDFGVYGLYISISTIIAFVASGKFDLALMLPKEKSQAKSLFSLSFILLSFVSFIVFVVSYLSKDYLFKITDSPLFLEYYFFIPISVFMISFSELCINWSNRNKYYKLISLNSLLKSSSNVFASIYFGLKMILGGLIFANILFKPLKTLVKSLHKFLKKDGLVILSGISVQQSIKIEAIYLGHNLKKVYFINEDNWMTLVMKKI